MKYQVWVKWEDPEGPYGLIGNVDEPLSPVLYDDPALAQKRIDQQFADGRYHAEDYYIKEICI